MGHNLRPAHIHFTIHKAGYKTQFSQLYSADDLNLETEVQFAVTAALIGHYEAHDDNEPAPDADVKGRWYSLRHRFVVMRGEAVLPMAPITGKAEGERAEMVVLEGSQRANWRFRRLLAADVNAFLLGGALTEHPISVD
jgi:hydroxyquinol 1,2-dioxygenase